MKFNLLKILYVYEILLQARLYVQEVRLTHSRDLIVTNEKVDLKLNIQKTKIMAPRPITSWKIDGETVETVADFILGELQNHCRW